MGARVTHLLVCNLLAGCLPIPCRLLVTYSRAALSVLAGCLPTACNLQPSGPQRACYMRRNTTGTTAERTKQEHRRHHCRENKTGTPPTPLPREQNRNTRPAPRPEQNRNTGRLHRRENKTGTPGPHRRENKTGTPAGCTAGRTKQEQNGNESATTS